MPTILRTREQVLALAASKFGVSWGNGNEWAEPFYGLNRAIDDCAMFVSWLLWGLPAGRPPYATLVSDIQLRNGLELHMGSDGIQPGDIVGWNWEGASPGNYDHTGVCSRATALFVYSIDANSGPSDQVGEYARGRGYVTSYVRPNYPGFASSGSTPLIDSTKGPLMFDIKWDTTGAAWCFTPNGYTQVGFTEYPLLQRIKHANDLTNGANWDDPKSDPLLPGEIKIAAAVFARCNAGVTDPTGITNAVKAAVTAALVGVDAKVAADILAKIDIPTAAENAQATIALEAKNLSNG